VIQMIETDCLPVRLARPVVAPWLLRAAASVATLPIMEIDEDRRRAVTTEALHERAVREQVRGRVPSVVVGAARLGDEVGVVAVGRADVEGDVAAAGSVPYRVGSITKTFTAALVLSLVEDGVLGLDDRVDEHLPGTPLGAVTVRALLSHSGGLQREVPGEMWASMQGPDGRELRDALALAELVDRPGARWHYSNLGYAVIGQVVERVTGTACPTLIDERLIAPLGLSATTWSRPAGAAVGYRVDPYADLVHREPVMDQAAVGVGGQLWSTAVDLLVWGDALAGGAPEIVAPSVVEAMHTLQVMVDTTGWTSGWGLGLILERRGDRVTSGHTGAMPGFLSALSIARATRAIAVALSNATRGAAVGVLAAGVVDDLAASASQPVPEPWEPVEEVPAELDGVLGRWWSEADETVFTWRAGVLHARLVSAPAASETRFERLGPDRYRAMAGRFSGERLTVRRDGAGAVVGLEWATYPFTRAPR
jgi:CubicO group peptidase (beta-lactamase class C family)